MIFLTRSVFTVLLMVIALLTSGQEWFHNGKTWFYDVTTGFDIPNYGVHYQEVTGDTLIAGKTCKKLKYVATNGFVFFDYVHQQGKKVYHFHNNGFELLYDFGLKVNDTLRLKNNYGIVQQVDQIVMQDSLINSMVVRYTYFQSNYYLVRYAEGIGIVKDTTSPLFYNCGPLIHTQNCNGAVDGWDYYLKCLQDGTFTYPEPGCEILLDLKEASDQKRWNLFPNPASEDIYIESDSNKVFQLWSPGGILLLTDLKTGLNLIEALPSGVYFLCPQSPRTTGDCRLLIIR